MSQDLTKRQTSSTVPQLTPSPREFLDRVASYCNYVDCLPGGKYAISDKFVPNEAELGQFRARYDEIIRGMKSNAESIRKRMTRMFLLFPVAGAGVGTMEETVAAYASVLSGFPLWAIDRACQKVIASGATFRPSAPELRKLADEACKSVYDEADSLQKLLSAEVYHQNTSTERERVKAGFKELMADLNKTNNIGRQTREEAIRDVEAGFPHLRGPVTLSPAVRASLGLGEQ